MELITTAHLFPPVKNRILIHTSRPQHFRGCQTVKYKVHLHLKMIWHCSVLAFHKNMFLWVIFKQKPRTDNLFYGWLIYSLSFWFCILFILRSLAQRFFFFFPCLKATWRHASRHSGKCVVRWGQKHLGMKVICRFQFLIISSSLRENLM